MTPISARGARGNACRGPNWGPWDLDRQLSSHPAGMKPWPNAVSSCVIMGSPAALWRPLGLLHGSGVGTCVG